VSQAKLYAAAVAVVTGSAACAAPAAAQRPRPVSTGYLHAAADAVVNVTAALAFGHYDELMAMMTMMRLLQQLSQLKQSTRTHLEWVIILTNNP
jgi:energy-converting hydrogenase Eha subunit E